MPHDLKICILSEYAYSLLTGIGSRFGGAELQMTILARELANRSYDVSFVTFEKSSNSVEMINNIKVYNPFNIRDSGYTYLHPHNVFKLLKILNKIDADIYIQKGRSPLTGVLAFFAKVKNKVFLYVASSEKHVSDNLSIKSIKDLEYLIYRFGVKYCDCVICQTDHQKNLIYQTIRKKGKVIKNLYFPPQIERNQSDVSKLKVLWVGRMAEYKKPELFLKLAKNIPEFRFWMIGGPSVTNPEYYDKIKDAASCMDNLEFIGFVPHNKINRYYSESSLLINTSPNEGFPNTFLEAWGNFIPVISLGFDPDGIICKHRLGFYSEDFHDLVKNTYKLLKNKSLRKNMGIAGRKYVEKEHNIDKIIEKYEQLFNEFKMKRKNNLNM